MEEMEGHNESILDLQEREDLLRSYGKSFLTDTIKDFKKSQLTQEEAKKWESYHSIFIECKTKQSKEIQAIKDEYLAKYILIVALLSEYEKVKEDFDRQNLKVEVVLSDILLHAKDEKMQNIFAQWINDKENQLNVFRELVDEMANPIYEISTTALEVFTTSFNKALIPFQAELSRLGQMFKKVNPSQYCFTKDMKQKAKLHGIESLLKVPYENYIRGLAIENIIENVCSREMLSVKLKREMLKVNSFRITQSRIVEIYDEIRQTGKDLDNHRASIDKVFRRYKEIGRLKKIEIPEQTVEKHLKLFESKAKSLKGKSIFEKQFELQPVVKFSIDSVQEELRAKGGC